MEMHELERFITEMDQVLLVKYNEPNRLVQTYARMTKLMEEVGELASEVLASNKHQRDAKLGETEVDGLGDEFADVIITTLLIAKNMDVDVWEALDRKMNKVRLKFMMESSLT